MGKKNNRGIEKLLPMGGFIQEYAEEKIYSDFTNTVANKIEEYCDSGENIWQIGDTIEQVLESFSKYTCIKEVLDEEEKVVLYRPENEFKEWVLDQAIRCKKEKSKSMEPPFWQHCNLKRSMKKKIMTLNALEEKVLSYAYGIQQKERMTPEEIAALPEFQCNPEYIKLVLYGIDKVLGIDCALDHEFNELCDAMRCKQEKFPIVD